LVVGVLVGGIGGRLVMRLAALAVPDAAGQLTANGNRIGDITAAGTVGLVVFVGLFAGIMIAVVWVTVAPWIPGTGVRRALVAMPVAIALGSSNLIDGHNPDFFVLDHDPFVVITLIVTIGLAGLGVALVDGWLDRRLPRPASRSPATATYASLTAVGLIAGLPLVLSLFLAPGTVAQGLALVVVGAATLAWWYQHARGADEPKRWTAWLGRGALLVAVVAGSVRLAEDLRLALLLS
jgi:hypothetical protein